MIDASVYLPQGEQVVTNERMTKGDMGGTVKRPRINKLHRIDMLHDAGVINAQQASSLHYFAIIYSSFHTRHDGAKSKWLGERIDCATPYGFDDKLTLADIYEKMLCQFREWSNQQHVFMRILEAVCIDELPLRAGSGKDSVVTSCRVSKHNVVSELHSAVAWFAAMVDAIKN